MPRRRVLRGDQGPASYPRRILGGERARRVGPRTRLPERARVPPRPSEPVALPIARASRREHLSLRSHDFKRRPSRATSGRSTGRRWPWTWPGRSRTRGRRSDRTQTTHPFRSPRRPRTPARSAREELSGRQSRTRRGRGWRGGAHIPSRPPPTTIGRSGGLPQASPPACTARTRCSGTPARGDD